jgi:hypothetical protein
MGVCAGSLFYLRKLRLRPFQPMKYFCSEQRVISDRLYSYARTLDKIAE